MDEIWRTISEARGYEVSSEGRVRNKKTGRILKLNTIVKTPVVSLMDAGKHLNRSVPLLVTRAFSE